MQEFTKVRYETSEQHKEATEARLVKDYRDAYIMMRYVAGRSPFVLSNYLFSLETGEVANSAVNVHQAKEIGKEILKGMVDIPVLQYSHKGKYMAFLMKK